MQEEILKQVQETALHKHVTEFLSSAKSCCVNVPIPALGTEEDLRKIAMSVCCQGAEILAGKSGSYKECCCQETCVKCWKANGDKPITVICGTVLTGSGEQGVDMLVPSSPSKAGCCGTGTDQNNCVGIPPAGKDVLTALLLALPPEIWSNIKDEVLLKELCSLMSTQKLPLLLQEEVRIFY